MNGLWRTACSALAIVLGLVPAAHAQDVIDRFLGRTVTAVELRVEGQPETSPAIVSVVDIKPGDRLGVEAWRRVAQRLMELPRFEGVVVQVVEQPEGVRLIFDLSPRHPIDSVEFPDDNGLPEAELKRQVRDRFGGVPSLTQQNDVESFVRRLLVGEGYLSAEVTSAVLRTHDPDRASLIVHVTAGARAVISRVEIQGNSPLSREQVLTRLDLAEGASYRKAAIDAQAAKLRDSLRALGYYTAIVQPQPTVLPDGTHVGLILRIEAGPFVQLRIEGDPLPGKEDDFIPIKREGSVDQDLLEDSQSGTLRAFRRQGYWKASVTFRKDQPSATELIITFKIDRGKRFKIVRVDLPPGLQITQQDLADDPALKPGVWFDFSAVEGSLNRIKEFYLLRGFHQVSLDPKLEEVPGRNDKEGGVVIVPNITEGPRAIVSQVLFDLGTQPAVSEKMLRDVMVSDQEVYVGILVNTDQQRLRDYYASLGFLNAVVVVREELNTASTEAAIQVTVREGPRFTVGELTIVGNEGISREEILRASGLKTGMPYNETLRQESQRRLMQTLAVQSVRITAEPRLPGETQTRLVIAITKGGAVTLSEGGGLEVGSRRRLVDGVAVNVFELAPRAFIEIGRRNLGGHNRSVSLFARVGLKRRGTTSSGPEDDSRLGFVEHRVTGTYRSAYAFGTDSDFVLSVTSEQAARTSFNFFRRSANAELLHVVTPRVSVSGRYSLDVTKRFDDLIPEDERSLIDRLFNQVRLSILSGSVFWDRHNNPITPTLGTTLDFAPRQLGSEVGFVRSFSQATLLHRLSPTSRLLFAGRAQFGAARGFERSVAVVDDDGKPVLGPDGTQLVQVVADLPASQRYFAGGSSSVRGFQLDTLAVREIMDDNGVSDGGNALIVLNAELRAAAGKLLGRNLTVVGFLDSGNVFDRVGDFNLRRLRSAVGFGFRYDSALGPIRLDFGFKLDRFNFSKSSEGRWAWHLSLGEVF